MLLIPENALEMLCINVGKMSSMCWGPCLVNPRSRCLRPFTHGPLTRYVKLRVAHAPGMPGTFSQPPRVSDPDMHHGTCVTHVPWYMPGSLTSGFLWNRRRGKRSRHSRCMRNRNFAYLVRGPLATWPWNGSWLNVLVTASFGMRTYGRHDAEYKDPIQHKRNEHKPLNCKMAYMCPQQIMLMSYV